MSKRNFVIRLGDHEGKEKILQLGINAVQIRFTQRDGIQHVP